MDCNLKKLTIVFQVLADKNNTDLGLLAFTFFFPWCKRNFVFQIVCNVLAKTQQNVWDISPFIFEALTYVTPNLDKTMFAQPVKDVGSRDGSIQMLQRLKWNFMVVKQRKMDAEHKQNLLYWLNSTYWQALWLFSLCQCSRNCNWEKLRGKVFRQLDRTNLVDKRSTNADIAHKIRETCSSDWKCTANGQILTP